MAFPITFATSRGFFDITSLAINCIGNAAVLVVGGTTVAVTSVVAIAVLLPAIAEVTAKVVYYSVEGVGNGIKFLYESGLANVIAVVLVGSVICFAAASTALIVGSVFSAVLI